MNTEHIAIGYRALEPARIKNFSLAHWQRRLRKGRILNTVDELHYCGTTACAGGYLALSPEFVAVGGSMDSIFWRGAPVYKGESGDIALYRFYGARENIEQRIINVIHGLVCKPSTVAFYNVDGVDNITPKTVQEKFAILYFILKFLEKNNER